MVIHKLISNISSGGYRGELNSIFKRNNLTQSTLRILKDYLEQFALTFSAHFEGLYELFF